MNFTIAIYICREFLRQKHNLSPPDVIKLIEKYTLPVRPGRKTSGSQATGIGKFSIQSGLITTYICFLRQIHNLSFGCVKKTSPKTGFFMKRTTFLTEVRKVRPDLPDLPEPA